ncbi:HupE/UreJ family protein [Phenylobacterium sp.]|uniref:HupE/UreJ family protein n=1 Tax=Phenylobacterium sp. TaxID=1871053 RepID=UPI00286BC83F|nr:HupE/UreJ family protein [Phenylobacterium sp.]
MRRSVSLVLISAGLAFCASPAWAHSGATLQGGFASGFLHPIGGPDHLLAMVAVGLWGAFLGRPLVLILPVIFPTVMAVGGVLGMLGVPMPPVELGIAVSVLMLGFMVAAAFRAPVWAASLVVGLFAVFHGYAHGQELPVAADPVAYSLGFVLATGLLHVAGIAVGMLNARPLGRVVTRGLGAFIAAAGVYFLYAAAVA